MIGPPKALDDRYSISCQVVSPSLYSALADSCVSYVGLGCIGLRRPLREANRDGILNCNTCRFAPAGLNCRNVYPTGSVRTDRSALFRRIVGCRRGWRIRVSRSGRDSAFVRNGAWFVIGLAMVRRRRIGLRRWRSSHRLADSHASHQLLDGRLSGRPAANQVGQHSQRRSLFPGYRAWFSGLGRRVGNYRLVSGQCRCIHDGQLAQRSHSHPRRRVGPGERHPRPLSQHLFCRPLGPVETGQHRPRRCVSALRSWDYFR